MVNLSVPNKIALMSTPVSDINLYIFLVDMISSVDLQLCTLLVMSPFYIDVPLPINPKMRRKSITSTNHEIRE